MRTISRGIERLLTTAAVLLEGCAGPTFTPDTAPEYVVLHAQTPLYRLGPQQAGAPDEWLKKDDRVRLVRREFGYSFALLPGGETGYVANDDIAPAPPLPREPPAPPSREIREEAAPPPRPDFEAMPSDAPER